MKNVLVSNTGPLIALSMIGRMNLLPELFRHGELKQNGYWIHDNIVEAAVHEAGE